VSRTQTPLSPNTPSEVAEHNARGFPQEWLPPTFAMCQLLNGLAAIFAGLLGAAAVQITGHTPPSIDRFMDPFLDDEGMICCSDDLG